MNEGISQEVQQIKQRFSIIGSAPALIYAINRARVVAPFDQSVLITGESGVGKESFPKIIHNYSPRKHNKYIAVNCGAIPEGTIDSALFGHEKGSFTGAISSRKGYFEEANGGTIFLDEVAELPLTTQARLLRVLENGEFIKVGSSEVQKTNIRIVAATNVNMIKAISEKKFREDLYYRLSTVTIEVPALRDRGNDVLLLARKFAGDFSERYRTPPIEFSDSARQALLTYRWPGNVRQLKNVIEQVALFHAGESVDAAIVNEHLPRYASGQMTVAGTPAYNYQAEREILFKMLFKMQHELDELRSTVEGMPKPSKKDYQPKFEHDFEDVNIDDEVSAERRLVKFDEYKPVEPEPTTAHVHPEPEEVRPEPETSTMTLEETERETIRRSLARNGGKRKKTADELHISERTLYRKIKEYGLE